MNLQLIQVNTTMWDLYEPSIDLGKQNKLGLIRTCNWSRLTKQFGTYMNPQLIQVNKTIWGLYEPSIDLGKQNNLGLI